MSTIGIHGFGRIGRAIFRSSLASPVFVGGINDRCDDGNLLYLLRHDSLAGHLAQPVTVEDGGWRIGNRFVHRSSSSRIDEVPWADMGIDVVIDASGSGSRKEWDAALERGVRSIVVTRHDLESDVTVVAGVNDDAYDPAAHQVISTSTCDANAAALVLSALQPLGLTSGSLLTLHPWLGYQNLLDGPISDGYPQDHQGDYSLGRAASINLIPKKTSVLDALGAVLPEAAGRLISMSYRVPTAMVSCLNLSIGLASSVSSRDVNELVHGDSLATGSALQYNDEPLVSTDFRGSDAGATFDARWTEVIGEPGVLRSVAWYDNEVGYSHQVLRVVDTIEASCTAYDQSEGDLILGETSRDG